MRVNSKHQHLRQRPKPTEDTPVTLESIHTMTEHLTAKLKAINRLLPKMTMTQLIKIDKGLSSLFESVETMVEDFTKPKKPRSRDYEPKDDNDDHDDRKKPPSKRWTPEMIFMDLLRSFPSIDIDEDEDYSDVKDMTIKEIGLTPNNVTEVIMRSVSGTKIKYPSFVRDDTATVKDLFETLKAAKVFRGRKGPIRDPDDHDD